MSLRCYRCGESLERLSLPLARLDACPACSVDLHVCRMCVYYQPTAPDGCTEEDADVVTEKARANFCDYFRPSPDAFDGTLLTGDRRARADLAALFGDEPETGGDADPGGDTAGSEDGAAADDPMGEANALFRR